MVSVLCAVLAAAANAGSSVLQRRAAMAGPDAGHRSLIRALLHRGSWFGGMGLLLAGFGLQATALATGSVAVVQPVLAAELPFTLVIAAQVVDAPRAGGRREWVAAAVMAAGLATALLAARPTAGHPEASATAWAVAVVAVVVVLGGLALAGLRSVGGARAAMFGATAGGLFGVTAVFMATAAHRLADGLLALFTAWQLWAMAAAGLAALYVLQHAYEAGTLAASQPGVTLADPVVAVALGVALFGQQIRLGWALLPETVGIVAVVAGAVGLSRSPLVTGETDRTDPTSADAGAGAGRR